MRDIHCHILPGVDDGARDLDESLRMWEAAKAVGVTSIVCTPHCRSPYFDYEKMWNAYHLLKDQVGDFPLYMGFEVNVAKLRELGMGWAERMGCQGSSNFLLELQVSATPRDFDEYEGMIFQLQGMGYTVIIAHPERYHAIQKDISLAERFVDMGCKLQASADFIAGGRLGKEKRPARKLFEDNLYSYIASDAHRVEHYKYLEKACEKYRVRGKHFK
ncbi:CpsB/CapC family capsule biosynthesis tyrosine phosphatase [uncultured Parolsenella sp.]|uniref:tyrosine-protein phosphatase n=1 Tax=uncultured Parolsenella sp. TaxID=2083008 RepID=UPI0025E141AF|nr:CpsB/CapC family capsule biosynthesis tyrosine phosphatase [uncultured Parolsenella sp.]